MKRFWRGLCAFSSSWSGTIIIVLFIIFFVIQGFIIPTRSMVGTFFEGDLLFVKKFSYGIPTPRIPWVNTPILPDFNHNGHLLEGERPKRGEIVVFIPPHERETYFVKRVFGVGGDEIIFTQEGYYLRPNEGDAGIEAFAQKLGESVEIREFLGKKFIKDPFISQYAGISYAPRWWQKDEAQNPTIAPLWKRAYFRDDRGFYTKICKDTNVISEADRRLSCDLFEKQYSDLPQEEFVYVSNIGFEDMNARFDVAMDKLRDRQGEVFFYTKIPDDHFFMAGDNRNNSSDSRFWGSVPYSNIVGQPWFIYFSFTKANSEEAGADMDTSKRYVVRWDRMFRGLDGIEDLARAHAERYRDTSPHNHHEEDTSTTDENLGVL